MVWRRRKKEIPRASHSDGDSDLLLDEGLLRDVSGLSDGLLDVGGLSDGVGSTVDGGSSVRDGS